MTETLNFAYQDRVQRRITARNGRVLLALDLGLGKSFCALRWAIDHDQIPIVIVCQAGLKGNWQEEAWKHFGIRCKILGGRRPKIPEKASIYIINYDILPPWVPLLSSLGAKTIIFDEGHFLKSRGTKRTKAARRLSRTFQHALILTGTPITNRPAELWSLLNILAPEQFSSFFAFCMRFCAPKRRPWGWEYKGAENLEELHNLLRRSVMVRVCKEAVLPQLPPVMHKTVSIPLSNRAEYDRAVHDFLAWLKEQSVSSAARAERAEQLSKMSHLLSLIGVGKVNGLAAWLQNLTEESDDKIALFGRHISVLDELQREFKTRCVRIDGSTPKEDRTKIVRKFNDPQGPQIFLGQIDAAGVGLNITGANIVIIAESVWTPAQVNQAIGRAYGRLCDPHGVLCYHVIAENTLDADILLLLRKKEKIINAVMDGESGSKDESVFNELIAQLESTVANE